MKTMFIIIGALVGGFATATLGSLLIYGEISSTVWPFWAMPVQPWVLGWRLASSTSIERRFLGCSNNANNHPLRPSGLPIATA